MIYHFKIQVKQISFERVYILQIIEIPSTVNLICKRIYEVSILFRK